MLLEFLVFFGGVCILLIGGDGLVRGASGIARSLGIPSVVVGLTVVSFGTSAPELAVTVTAAFQGVPDLGVGNVIGSNILNTLVILGVGAVLAPMTVQRKLIRYDIPIMILATVAAVVCCWDYSLSRVEGGFLAAGLVAYIVFSLWEAKRGDPDDVVEEEAVRRTPLLKSNEFWMGAVGIVLLAIGLRNGVIGGLNAQISLGATAAYVFLAVFSRRATVGKGFFQFLLIIGGLYLLVCGAEDMVIGASAIAERFGVDPRIVGLTIVSGGTSMPEIAVTIIAAWRGESDIAIGNVVGSNIFNIFSVLGITASIAALPVEPAFMRFDIWIVLASAVLLLPLTMFTRRIGRTAGAILLVSYLAYLTKLIVVP